MESIEYRNTYINRWQCWLGKEESWFCVSYASKSYQCLVIKLGGYMLVFCICRKV